MTTNYSSWPLDKLRKEKEKIKKAIKIKETRNKKAALAQIASVARKNGFELHELMSTLKASNGATPRAASKGGKKRGKVAPKYQNPQDASQTWTGRGRQPLWVKQSLAQGKTMQDIAIKQLDWKLAKA